MAKKKKKQIATFRVPQAKHAVAAKVEQREGHPSWRFEDIDNDGPFAWKVLSGEQVHELMVGLKHFEQQSIEQTKGRHSKGTQHPCDVAELDPTARARLVEIRLDDHDRLWAFRAMNHQEQRVWAVRYGDVFHFVWWDPDHKVTPSTK